MDAQLPLAAVADGEGGSSTVVADKASDPASVSPTSVRSFKASELPLSSAMRSAIEGLAHTFKKKGGYDAIRKQAWEKFEESVCTHAHEIKEMPDSLNTNCPGLRRAGHEIDPRGRRPGSRTQPLAAAVDRPAESRCPHRRCPRPRRYLPTSPVRHRLPDRLERHRGPHPRDPP